MSMALAGGGLLTLASNADAASKPLPWVAGEISSGEQVGTLSFYDANGSPIYSGSLDATPMQAYIVASGGPITGNTVGGGATAYLYAPSTSDPGLWSNSQMTGTSPDDAGADAAYTVLPPSIQTSNREVVKGALSFTDALAANGISNQLGAGNANVNVYEIRVVGNNTDQKWYSADVEIDTATNTWTQVYPQPPDAATWVSTPVANPGSVAPAGTTSVALSATLSTGDGAHASGSVEVFDGSTDLGTANYDSATGAITATVVKTAAAGDLTDAALTNGSDHSFQFKYTPAGADSHTASSSAVLAWSIHNPVKATTTVVSGPSTGTVGSVINYKATVTAGSTTLGPGDGTVQLMLDGTTPIGIPADPGQSVGYTPADGSPHTITATFTPADSQTYGSSSDSAGVTVTAKYPTFLSAITANPADPAPTGTTSVTLTGTLTTCPAPRPTTWTCPAGNLPAGTVTVKDGSTSLGNANYNATTGTVTATIAKTATVGDLLDPNLLDGTRHFFTFNFSSSDVHYIGGVSTQSPSQDGLPLSWSINSPATATTTIMSGPTTGTAGNVVTLTATVAAVKGTDKPDGFVQFSVDGQTAGIAPATVQPTTPPSNAGNATYRYTPTTGVHVITAIFVPADTTKFVASNSGAGLTFTTASAPSEPAAPSATAGNASSTLSWIAPAANGSAITKYNVQYSTDGGMTQTSAPDVTTTQSAIAGLTNGTAYQFRVRAVNSIGYSAWSPWSAAVTPSAPSVPQQQPTPAATPKPRTVTISAKAKSIKKGKSTSIFGAVAPVAGGQVTLYKQVGKKWVKIGTATVKLQKLPNGKKAIGYVFTIKGKKKGSTVYHVVIAAITGYLTETSGTVKITVK